MEDKSKQIQYRTYNKRDVILFNSYSKTKSVVLSNHYPCTLTYGGYTFNSTEQLFFCIRLSDYPDCQKKIMECKDAKEVKKKGNVFLRTKGVLLSMSEVEIPALRFCLQLKYQQCEEFRTFLQGTDLNKAIVEYAPWGDDKYGAVDTDETNRWNWYKGQVRGQNICGRLIREIRKKGALGELLVTPPEFAKMFGERLIEK